MESVVIALKRKRSSEGEEESLASKKENQKKSSADPLNFNLDDILTDDLLIEVLLRLPTSKSAIHCTLVSKRWHSLISTPSFISQFISHHKENEISKNNTDSYAASYLLRPDIFMTVWGDPSICFITDEEEEDGDENSGDGYILQFLPEPMGVVAIVASCNDLLLCRANEEWIYDLYTSRFYICNPFTKKWLLLPSSPIRRPTTACNYTKFLGLVCEPNYRKWLHLGRQQQQQQIHQSRFRVVCYIPLNESDSVIHVYCSETGRWYQSHVPTRRYHCAYGNIVAHDGKLYWYNGSDIVAYDPFNNDETIFLKIQPFRIAGTHVSSCLGICQGSLRFVRIVYDFAFPTTDHLSVWELTDYESRTLSLVGKIFFNSMRAEDNLSRDVLSHYKHMQAIAIHPDNKDLVYLKYSADYVVSCNIQTRQLKLIGETGIKNQHGICAAENFLPIALPWWPTPVSSLPKILHFSDAII